METISTGVVEDKSLRDTRGRRIMDAQRREELFARYRANYYAVPTNSRSLQVF